MPKTISFKPLAQATEEPEFLISDFAKLDSPATLHVAFNALSCYRKAHNGALPRPWNEEDANSFLGLPISRAAATLLRILYCNSIVRVLYFWECVVRNSATNRIRCPGTSQKPREIDFRTK